MKYLLIIFLFLNSVCNAQNRDSTTYAQFRYDFMNVKVVPSEQMRYVDNSVFKPVLILLGTFALNYTIISINEKNKNHKNTGVITGSIFIIGGTASFIVFSKELKKRKRIQLN